MVRGGEEKLKGQRRRKKLDGRKERRHRGPKKGNGLFAPGQVGYQKTNSERKKEMQAHQGGKKIRKKRVTFSEKVLPSYSIRERTLRGGETQKNPGYA